MVARREILFPLRSRNDKRNTVPRNNCFWSIIALLINLVKFHHPQGGDPLKFLETVMNHVETDPKLRVDAAKALASFKVAKPGEKGKKGETEERAKKEDNRFAPVAAPGLKAVK